MGIDEYRRAGGENVAKATSTPDESSVSPYRNEENSLDMLKNTPSNIARLADEIEQCEGRQKYLAQTRSPSDGGDVRWYFCKVPLGMNGESSAEPSSLPSFEELAASVPRTEIVGKGEYFRFGMRDSLAIEASFLQREEELLSYWWKEYAECSEGPKGQCGSSPEVDFDTSFQISELYAVEEERVGVPVKGGLYEVDLLKRHSFPVYWNGDYRRVLRGQWFALSGGLDWLPLREDVAEQLEFAYRRQVWHRRTFQPSGLFAARINLQGPTSGLHALFTGEDDTWEAWLNVDASGFSNVISLGGNGIKLRRGYSKSQSPKPTQDELRQQKEEQMDDYCSQVPVQHLVFMVHGIGQRLEKSNLVDDVGNFRHITSALAEKHLTSYQRSTKRVLFIPCQWRKGLKLSSESAVEKITLDGVRGLRTALSATVHDVLYYMSPIYCQDIIDSVSNQLNLLYLKFLKRNPGYEGKVSIYGHSLGSVLSYDILCHQGTLSSSFPMDCMYPKEEEKNKSPNYLSKPSPECNSRTGGAGNMSHDIHDVNLSRHLPSATLANELGEDSHSTVGLDPCILSIRERMPSMDVKNDVNANSASSVDDLGAVSEPSDAFHQGNDVIWTMNSGNTETEPNMLTSNLNAGLDDESGNIAAGTSNAAVDKDTEVLALRAQINTLKMRVAELESHFGGDMTSTMCQASQDVHAAVTNKDDNQKVPPGHNDSPKSYKPYIKYTKLGFKVDTFFAVGSPLGVFLALRNVRLGIGKGKEYWEEGNIIEEMPACKRMFNIFHPFDPVAYRVEPLICKEYVSRRPVIVPYHRGGKRLHIGLQDFAEDMAARSQAIVDHLNFLRAKVLTVCESRNKESLEEGVDGKENTEERSYGSMMMEHLSGSAEGRIDYVLQDKTFQHPYISALGSHTNYWRDYDTALFILKHLYCDVPDDSGHQEGLYSGGLKGDSRSAVSSGTGEYAEELPLTFSDSALVKSFSKSSKLL